MIERLRESVLLVLISLVLFACRTDFSAQLTATESLLAVLSNVENSASQVDVRLIDQYRKDVTQKCEKIQAELSDTLNIEKAEMLVRFCGLSEHFESCINRKELIDAEILRTRNQLFNLKTDLFERRSDKDSANHYIEQEFLFVESLSEGIEQLVVELNGCFETYGELKEEIDRLLIALPAKASE